MKNTTILLSLALLVLSMVPVRADDVFWDNVDPDVLPVLIDRIIEKSKAKPILKRCECVCTTQDGLELTTADVHRMQVPVETDCSTVQPIAGLACHGYTEEEVEIIVENQNIDDPLAEQEYPPQHEGTYVCTLVPPKAKDYTQEELYELGKERPRPNDPRG